MQCVSTSGGVGMAEVAWQAYRAATIVVRHHMMCVRWAQPHTVLVCAATHTTRAWHRSTPLCSAHSCARGVAAICVSIRGSRHHTASSGDSSDRCWAALHTSWWLAQLYLYGWAAQPWMGGVAGTPTGGGGICVVP